MRYGGQYDDGKQKDKYGRKFLKNKEYVRDSRSNYQGNRDNNRFDNRSDNFRGRRNNENS